MNKYSNKYEAALQITDMVEKAVEKQYALIDEKIDELFNENQNSFDFLMKLLDERKGDYPKLRDEINFRYDIFLDFEEKDFAELGTRIYCDLSELGENAKKSLQKVDDKQPDYEEKVSELVKKLDYDICKMCRDSSDKIEKKYDMYLSQINILDKMFADKILSLEQNEEKKRTRPFIMNNNVKKQDIKLEF